MGHRTGLWMRRRRYGPISIGPNRHNPHRHRTRGMPALKRNLKVNKPLLRKNLKYSILYWNNIDQINALNPPFDFVIAADVVYIEESVPQLVSAMDTLLSPDGVVLLGYQIRSPEAHVIFWELCGQVFDVEKLPHDHLHPEYAYEVTHVYLLRKKKKQ